jgi:isoleucyl-tRNA synthetase
MRLLKTQGHINVNVDGQDIHLAEEDLLIESVQPEGLSTESDRDFTIALDTRLTPDLIEEGLVRELVSKIQTMRKDQDFEVSDHVVIRFSGNEALAGVFARNRDEIAAEVLAERIEAGEPGLGRAWDINGQPVELQVTRIKV